MDLSWELELLARAAVPGVVLDGRHLLHRVSDVLQCEGGGIQALVRGEEPQVVSLPWRYPLEGASCTCGRSGPRTPCAHAIAAWLRALQRFHGLDDARLARWEQWVESLHALSAAWDRLANVWIEATTAGDVDAAAAVFRDASSLDGGIQIVHALARRASTEQLSAFLIELAATRGIDGKTPLGPEAIIDAYELAVMSWSPAASEDRGASTALLLAVAASARRTALHPTTNWRVDSAFTFSCGALGYQVAGGHTDPALVADALLQAEIAAPVSTYPWITVMFDHLGDAAQPVAREMRSLLEHRAGEASAGGQQHRIGAEIGFASEGVPGLLPVLDEWADAPYGEFLCRLPGSWVPTPRLQLLEAAYRKGRVRWAPGWPQHVPRPGARRAIRLMHDLAPQHSMWGDIAIGDVVLAVAQLGRGAEARGMLQEHARRNPDPRHRHEFERIWAAAKFGGETEESASEIFGPATDDLGELLAAIARIPERYFESDLSEARQGIGTVLLTAILLEDIVPETDARNQDAAVWATSFFSSYPAAIDDLDACAALPAEEISCHLEGVVLDQDRALRIRRVASQLIAGDRPLQSMADAQGMGEHQLVDVLERAPDAGPLAAALVSLIVWGRPTAALQSILNRFLRHALGETSGEAVGLLEKAYRAEPRGADFAAYLFALIAVELDDRAQRLRRR